MDETSRRARPPMRCLTDDLGIALPAVAHDLGDVAHPLMDEARRVASTSPQGQKRVLSIDDPLVYRLQRSQWRGVSWVDERFGVLWLMAGKLRRAGSRDDAYEYFKALHHAGRLLPTEDDLRRDRAEAANRFLRRVEADARAILERARAGMEQVLEGTVANRHAVRLCVRRSGGVEEIWLAVSVRDIDGAGVPERVRNMIFAQFECVAGDAEWEWQAEWPIGSLPWFEIARLGLRES